MLNIAIIDSGIDTNHPRLRNCSVKGVTIIPEKDHFLFLDTFNDTLGHGTAIAGIIHKHIPNATLWAVKIFDNTLSSNESVLVEAIRWCLEREDISIINLSLGILTNNPSIALSRICEKAFELNKVLISAKHIDPKLVSYPANFPFVFSVSSGNTNKEKEYGITTNSRDSVEFLAKGTIQRVAWKNQECNIVTGTSYSCAHFTGIVANYLKKESISIELLKQILIRDSSPEIKNTHQSSKLKSSNIPVIQPEKIDEKGRQLFSTTKMDWIGRFTLFPSSEKEMKTLISLLESRLNNLKYTIDYPRSLSSSNNSQQTLSRILNDEEWNNVDTLIVGYFYDHPFEANVRFGYNLVSQSIIRNKNLFLFDKQLLNNIEADLLKSYKGRIYSPVIDQKSLNEIMNFEYLPSVKIPVLAVIGTTNRQGKFSAQIRLKDIMERNGYSVAMLSTEPHGELLGSVFSFPYGFSSTVHIPRSQWRHCVGTIMKGIAYYETPHVILTGTQGCLLPQKNANAGNETSSFDFLLGVEPDCLLCAVNPEDTIEEICDTVILAKLLTNADVLLFILSPWERNYQVIDGKTYSNHYFLDNNEYEEKKLFLKDKLGKEVINIMDNQDMIKALQIIEDYFK